jgi:hypothetical protein
MTHDISRRQPGFTRLQVAGCLLIVLVLAAVLYPFSMRVRSLRSNHGDASQEKLIALGFLQYIQDYDETWPPANAYVILRPRSATAQPTTVAQNWAVQRTLPDGRVVPGLLTPYFPNSSEHYWPSPLLTSNLRVYEPNDLFRDAQLEKEAGQRTTLCMMYNDLLATEPMARLSAPSATVVITNAEDQLANAGHTLDMSAGPFRATFNRYGKCDPGQGASIRWARFRRSSGANFAFANGHVKWYKGSDPESVFFPPRASAQLTAFDPKTKQQTGPIPGTDMTFQGRHYSATFHLR